MIESVPNHQPEIRLETCIREVSDTKEHRDLFLHKIFEKDPKEGMTILFRTYYVPLCSHAVRFVYSKQIAEDLVSEVFFQFYRSEAYKDIRISYTSYLFRSVRNEAFSYLNREFGRTMGLEVYSENVPFSGQHLPDMEVHYNHLLKTVNDLVAGLPSQCRKVFLMNRFENKKYQEIADELHISPKTVEVHISKALKILRQKLKGEWLGVLLLLSW